MKWVLLNIENCAVTKVGWNFWKWCWKYFHPTHLAMSKTLFSSLNSRKLWSIECISYRVFKLLGAPNDSHCVFVQWLHALHPAHECCMRWLKFFYVCRWLLEDIPDDFGRHINFSTYGSTLKTQKAQDGGMCHPEIADKGGSRHFHALHFSWAKYTFFGYGLPFHTSWDDLEVT